jgi:hypothetical protein
MDKKEGSERIRQLLVFIAVDIEKWRGRGYLDEAVRHDMEYYLRELSAALDEVEDRMFDLAGRNAAAVLAPRRDFLVSRELDAEAETAGRVDPDDDAAFAPDPDECQVCHMVSGHRVGCPKDPSGTPVSVAAEAPLRGPDGEHVVYRRKGQQRPEWSV